MILAQVFQINYAYLRFTILKGLHPLVIPTVGNM